MKKKRWVKRLQNQGQKGEMKSCDESGRVNKELTSGGSFSGLVGKHLWLRTVKKY